jgi:hypothetical protein
VNGSDDVDDAPTRVVVRRVASIERAGTHLDADADERGGVSRDDDWVTTPTNDARCDGIPSPWLRRVSH